MKKTILLVEDEDKLRETISEFFCLYDYEVIVAKDGQEAIEKYDEYMDHINMVLLDIMLPVHDGQYVLTHIRKVSDVPVIMLTAKTGNYEQIKSFGNGVDDYITKPFVLALLKARVEAVLKRVEKQQTQTGNVIHVGDLKVDYMARKIYVNDTYVVTTPKEFEVLSFLIKNRNVALKRTQILEAIWGEDYSGTARTVDTVIKQIRIKLGEECPYIKSIYGVGYIFEG